MANPWERYAQPASESDGPWNKYSSSDASEEIKPKTRSVTDSIVDTGIDAVRGVVGAGESLVGIADLATGNLAGRGLSAIGYDPKETNRILASGYSDRRKEADQAVQDAKGFTGTVGALIDNPSAAFGTIVQSAPMSLTGAAAVRMAATKMLAGAGIEAGTTAAAEFLKRPEVAKRLLIAGGASEGAMTSGSIEEQSRQAGRDYTDSVLPALAGGAITGAIGYGSSKIPGFKDAEVAAATAGMGAKNSAGLIAAGKEIAKSAIKEGVLEELPQSAQEQVFTNLALGKPWSEGVGEAAAQGMVAGMGTGVGMTTYSEVANRLGKSPTPLTEMAAKESARQRTAVTGEEHAIIDAPDGKKAVVPASVLKNIQQPATEAQQAAPEAVQPIEQQNTSLSTDDILGSGQGMPAQDVSPEDAAMLQRAHEQGVASPEQSVAAPVDTVIEQDAALTYPVIKVHQWPDGIKAPVGSIKDWIFGDAAGNLSSAATQEQGITLQEDHIGITPESLDNLFASQGAQHASAITQPEVMNGASTTPTAPGLDATPAEQWSADATGSAPDSLRGNEGGINATGDRLAGQPAPGIEQADAGLAGTDNAVAARIDAAAHEAATSPLNDLPEPTQAMKEAGNYKKAHVSIQGIDVAIENPKGSVRSGTDENGSWSVTMPDHYGYIKRTEGADGDALDTFIGNNPESNKVFVVDQVNPGTGKFEQHKAMMGFDNAQDAMSSYQSAFTDKGKERMGAVAEMNIDQFKNWLAEGDTKKPLAPQIQNAPAQKKAPVASENLLSRIKQLGGINLSHIRDVTGERNPKNVRAVGLFSKTGKGLDDLAVMLHDDGFDVGMHDANDNGGVNRLSDQIRSALDGNTVLTMAATERKATADAEAEYNHNIKEQAKALGIKTVARKMAAIEADVIDKQKAINKEKEFLLYKELRKLGLELDAALFEAQSLIGEDRISAGLRYAGEFIENNDITDESAKIRAMISAIQSEITLRNQHDEIQDPDARQVTKGIAGQSDRAGGIKAGNGENREGESGNGFELTGQTAEELKAATEAEGRAREADAQETARLIREERNSADASVKASNVLNGNAADSFSLSATEPVSKVQQKAIDKKKAEAEMHGQVDLLSQPDAESKPADKITLMAVSNKPFPTERVAQSSIKQRKLDATVVPVDGGFGIKHAPEQDVPEDSQNAGAEPAQSDDQAARQKADIDFDDAMSDLGDIFGKNFRATFTPEQEQKIIPVLTRLFDAAFRKGYYKFKDAARFVLDSIANRLGNEIENEITIDHLSGAYIGMAGRYKDQGADSRRDVIAFESKDELGESNVTDERSGTNLERDSENTNTSDGVGAQGVRDGRNGDGGAGGQGILNSESESGPRRSDGVSGRDAATDGEHSNLEIYTGAPADEASIARDSVNQRSDSAGVDGPPIESDATSVAEELAESGISLEEARSEQRAADKQEHKPGIENIRETLPILTDAQQDDVAIAETRFAKPDGYGMLFTNGTGTGKTFLGLGIIKRFVMDGKSNIIITAPNDKIADDWKKAGRLLGLDITRLLDTKSAGSGVVIATYANFGQNNELAKRNWDLIVHDEAHYLTMDKDGTNTLSLHNLRAISMNPAGASTRASMLHADLIENLAKVRGEIKSARESGDNRILIKLPPLEAKEKALADKFRAAVESVKSDVASKQGSDRPRVLFLSATPFAYEKTVDWANGYLFDYNEGRGNEGSESRGYNAGNNRDQFMMQNFGYRMRYGKLTAPDAKVDSGLMQRQFNTMLKKSGVLSGRMLDVKADYDRRFVLVDSAIGRRIDAALQWFEDQRTGGKDEKQIESDAGKSRSEALRDLRDVIGEKFDYLSRRYLLEAIKAQEVIPHVKEHMALGRKVVVFHDYKKGGGFNPFNVSSVQAGGDVDPARASAFNAAVREFRAEFKDLIESDVWHASSPITAFQQAFSGTTHPKVLLFNGDVSAKDRRAAVEKFQDDASGPQVILVQSAAGKEGISMHDTTGKHQRVLFNLGQPTQPTTAIQQEGRIYRTGQATDAIFRYLNTGTNWEKWAFATTIAQRASAAENLGMGEQARALKDAFITGFEESDDYRAGMEGEGKGGKERDKAANNALTEYDRARAFYFGTQKKNSRTKAQEGTDYFATPEPVGLKMVELADIRPGESAIEPSAGHGAIARWMPTTAERFAIEPSTVLRPRLAMVFDGKIIGSDFEDMHVSNKFDAIVMNPPFGVGGKTAIEHLAKAATHLRDGGRIVALIPQGGMADKRFDKWMYSEEERPIKPLGSVSIDGVVTQIYRGDTIESRAAWAPTGKVTGWHEGAPLVKAEGAFAGTSSVMVSGQSIKSVQSTGKRTGLFRPSQGFNLVADIKLPSVTFERAGTAVNTRIVVIEKSDNAPQQATRDYSNVADINELFDRMESLSIPPRAKAAEVIEEPAPPKRESKVAALDAQAKAKEADAVSSGQIAASSTDATFEIKNGKLVTNAPTEKVITGKGKELEGVFVPFDKLTQAQVKEADAFTYMPKGKASGWFVRLRHVERPSTGLAASSESPVFSHEESAPIPESEWLSDGAIAQIVEDRLSQFKHQPKILIHGRVSDVLRDATGNGDDVISGMVHGGKIHLFKDGMGSASAVTRTLWHELLHYGIRRFMTKEQYIASMQKLYSRDAWIKEKADAWVSTPDADEAKKSGMAYARARGVDEALADIAEKNAGENINNGVIAKTIRSVTTWAADLADRFGFTDAATRLRGVSSVEAKAFVSSVFGKLRNDEQAISDKWDFDADPAFARQQPIGLNTPAQPGSSIPEETWPEKKLRQFQDHQIRWKVTQDAIVKQGGKIEDKSNVSLALKLFPGRVAAAFEAFQRNTVDPLLERVTKGKFHLADIEEYLYAMHAPERNAQIAKINDRFQDGGSGMSNAEAAQIILKYRQMENFEEFKALANDFRKITVDTQKMLVKYGVHSQAHADSYSHAYKQYVPLKGFEAIDADGRLTGNGTGLGNSTNSKLDKRAKGRSSRAGQILANIMRDHEAAIMAAEKANVGRVVRNFVEANPNDKMWTVEKIPQQDVVIKSARKIDNTTDTLDPAWGNNKVGEKVVKRDAQFDPEKEIQFIEGDNAVRIQFADSLLPQAYNKTGMDLPNEMLQYAANFNAFLRQVYTQKNPAFFLMNPLRDVQSMGIKLTSEVGVKTTAQAFKHWPAAWLAVMRYALQDKASTSHLTGKAEKAVFGNDMKEMTPWMNRYRKAGGSVGFAYIGDITVKQEKIENQLRRIGGVSVFEELGKMWQAGMLGDVATAKKHGVNMAQRATFKLLNNQIFDLIEHLNLAFENASRLATFRACAESGMSDAQSALQAKNVTTNFNDKGEQGSNVNALFLFANANIQGSANLAKALTKAPHAKKAWAMVAGIAALGFMAGRGDGDDDDKIEPDYEAQRYWRIDLGEGKRFTIPKPYGWSFFYDLGRSMAHVTKNKNAIGDESVAVASSFLGNFSPVGNPIPSNKLDWRDAVAGVMPTIFKPAVQIAVNRTSFGSPLRPENSNKPNQPDSEKAFRKTRGGFYDDIAKGLNSATGGDVATSGLIDVSPEHLKLLATFLTGGSGRFLTDSYGTGGEVLSGDGVAWENAPIVRMFYRTTDVDDYRARFYQQADEVKALQEKVSTYKNADEPDKARAIRQGEDGNLLRLKGQVKRAGDKVADMRDEEEAVRSNEALSSSEKKAEIKAIEQKQIDKLKEFNAKFKNAKYGLADARR